MQGLEATFDDLSFEGGESPKRVLPKIVPFGAALAFAGAISVWALHWQGSTLPDAVLGLWPSAPTATHAISKPFADIAIDANLAAQLNSGAPEVPSQQLATLEPAAPFPLPSLEAFPPSSPSIPQVGSVPLPPGRDAPEIGETESSTVGNLAVQLAASDGDGGAVAPAAVRDWATRLCQNQKC